MRHLLMALPGFLCLAAGQSYADSANVSTLPPAYQGGSQSQSMTPSGGLRVQPMSGGSDVGASNPLYVFPVTSPSGSTTINPDISSVTTGGTPVNALSAGHCIHGCYITNPDNAAQLLCGNDAGAASGIHSNAGTICAPAGGQITFSPTNNAISVVSSDSSHTFAGKGSQ